MVLGSVPVIKTYILPWLRDEADNVIVKHFPYLEPKPKIFEYGSAEKKTWILRTGRAVPPLLSTFYLSLRDEAPLRDFRYMYCDELHLPVLENKLLGKQTQCLGAWGRGLAVLMRDDRLGVRDEIVSLSGWNEIRMDKPSLVYVTIPVKLISCSQAPRHELRRLKTRFLKAWGITVQYLRFRAFGLRDGAFRWQPILSLVTMWNFSRLLVQFFNKIDVYLQALGIESFSYLRRLLFPDARDGFHIRRIFPIFAAEY